jgi:FkbM family methyltransferase
MIKSLIKDIFIKPAAKLYLQKRYYHLDRQAHPSFSQMGEDMIVRKLFERNQSGFYVDIGAYHPKQFSNTYYFYIQGWRGITIEAMPGSSEEFKSIRPRDKHIEIGISDKKQKIPFYIFDQPALNTFSKSHALQQQKKTGYKIIKQIQVKLERLDTVLEKNIPAHTEIDLMSIDVEGMDLAVLFSNNWKKFLPKVIIVEDATFSILNPQKSKIYTFLIKKGYKLVGITDVSLVFTQKNLSL